MKKLVTAFIFLSLFTSQLIGQNSSIGDFVWEDTDGNGLQDAGEPGVAGVEVLLSSGALTFITTTDPSGKYSFNNLAAGSYSLVFTSPGTSWKATANEPNNTTINSDIDPLTLSTATFVLGNGEAKTDIDAGFYRMCTIGNYVWYDTNRNGVQDSENGLNGLSINLYKKVGNDTISLASAQSGQSAMDGRYSFGGLSPGTYLLQVDNPLSFRYTINNQGSNINFDSNINAETGFSDDIVLISGEIDYTIDAGLVESGCTDTLQLSPTYSIEGDELRVDYFVMSGETNVTSMQFGFLYDNNIFEFKSLISDDLNNDGLAINSFNPGKIVALWTSPTGQPDNFDNNLPLFHVTYKILATEGSGFIKLNPEFPGEFVDNTNIPKCISLVSDQFNPNFGFVKGRLTLDNDKNCIEDLNPIGLENWLVIFSQGSKKYYRNTNYLGEYNAGLAPGQYSVTVQLKNDLYDLCGSSQEITIVDDQTISNIDFLAQSKVDCAVIKTDITAPFLRRCFDNTYTIYYENIGTIIAANATIEIELDDDLTFVSTSMPHTKLGNVIKYNIGNIASGAKGSFRLTVNANCNTTVLGETHCVTVKSFPNNPCIIPANYAGSNIEAKAECNETTGKVKLTLTNVGTSAMPATMQYIVTEDDVMRPPVNYQLGAQQSLQVDLDADGTTYGIMTQQEPNYPTPSRPSIYIEGCRVNGQGSFSTGFMNTFVLNDSEPFIDILCLENIGSYDPNDITGFPKGYGNKKYIEKYTKIEYLVRFQNTGSDTAFNIRVNNVIPENLDITTFSMKGASHDYTYDFINQRELVVKFKDILLVDSNRNEALSHGYFTYEIVPMNTLKDEDKINNLADIYFDFNAPIQTNRELHTIGRPIFVSSIENIDPANKLIAFPNPSYDRIYLQNITDGQYILTDMNGRIIEKGNFENSVKVEHLPVGIYQIMISKGAKTISTISIVKQ